MAAPRRASNSDDPARGVELALAPLRRKYEDEVQRLVGATLALMQNGDTTDPTVSEILARAELSTTAFYRHFPTKDDLFVALLEQAQDMTAAHIESRLRSAGSPVDRIERWVRAVFDLGRSSSALARNRPLLLAHTRLLQRFPTEINGGFDALARPLEAAMAEARHDTGLPAGDPQTDARLALHQVFGILIDAAAMNSPVPGRTIDAVVGYTMRAVLAPEHRAAAATTPRRSRRSA